MLAGLFFTSYNIGIKKWSVPAIQAVLLSVFYSAIIFLPIYFFFVGGTYLLTKTYQSEERFKVQAFNDFCVFGIQALASLLSGLLLHYSSWQFLNQMAFFILIAIASIFLFYQKSIRAF